jgi:acetyl esterase/lipase
MVFMVHLRLVGLFVLVLLLPGKMIARTGNPPSKSIPDASYEKYGTTPTGVDLYWTAFVPGDGLRHPAVLVLHPGGFKTGDAGPENVAQDLGNAGFLGLAVEYRLAPPHDAMDSPTHPVPGQNDIKPVDDGHYPEQTDDVQLAIRTARADPRCDGRVYCVGGSAGGSHALYMAATATAGDDRPDLVVGCSGVYNMYDPSFIGQVCNDASTCPHSACTNYLGIPDNYPNFSPQDIAALTAASPVTYLTAGACPIFVMHSTIDGTGIPETFDLLLQKMIVIGLNESTSNVPEAGKYKQATIPVQAYAHAFEYWYLPFDGVPGHSTVATTVIHWLQAGPPTSSQAPSQELLNVSTRTQVLGGDSVLIGGFIVSGNIAKSVVLRALGPSLADLGVTGVLTDPTLELYDATGTLVQQNDNWVSPLPANVVAAGLTPKSPAESLIVAMLPPGSYTAVLQGAGGSTGVGLFELYDLDPVHSRVSNLSTRGPAASGNQAMIGGFIVGGTQSTNILLRGLGPSLTALGVSGALQDPVLELHASDGSLIAANDNWRDNQEQQIIATTIPPSNDKESAIIATLAPGNYTALVRGEGTSSGIALVEVYDLTNN